MEDTPDLPSLIPWFFLYQQDSKAVREYYNPTKAGGPDEVAGEFFKEVAAEIAPFPSHLYKKSLEDGTVPLAWNK